MKIDDLKNKILQLAIQGKLVPQDENDEPASVLLEKIREEKEQLIKEKKIKKEKPLPEISEEEKAFEIPRGWQWCRLNEVCVDFLVPQRDKPKKFDGDIPWCRIEDIDGKYLNGTKSEQFVSRETVEKMNLKINPIGTIICSCSASLGVQAIVTVPCCTNQTFIGLVPSTIISNEYIYYYLMSQKKYFYEIGAGTTIPYISKKKFQELRFPLPPLQEQMRIVNKVETLFKISNDLDENKDAMAKAISDTRNKVLQLAIQGKLVKQDENDEPASVLLEKIRQKKEKLIKEKKIKKEKPLAEISDEEKAFEIPKGWQWCRFAEALICRDGERKPVSSKERGNLEKIYDYYGASGVIDKIDNYLFDKPLLLIGEDGANLISRSTPIAFIAKGNYWVNNHAHVLESIDYTILRYFEIFINAIDLKPYVTGTAQPKLNQANMSGIPVSLPPLSEQKRIVAKVDEIMKYLDNLEKNLLL